MFARKKLIVTLIFNVLLLGCSNALIRSEPNRDYTRKPAESKSKESINFKEKFKKALEAADVIVEFNRISDAQDEKAKKVRDAIGSGLESDLARMNWIDRYMNSIEKYVTYPQSPENADSECRSNPTNGITRNGSATLCPAAFEKDIHYLGQTILHELVHVAEHRNRSALHKNTYGEPQYNNPECRASRIELLGVILSGAYPQNTSSYFYNDCRLGFLAKSVYLAKHSEVVSLASQLKPGRSKVSIAPTIFSKVLLAKNREASFNDDVGLVSEDASFQLGTRECMFSNIVDAKLPLSIEWSVSEMKTDLIQNDQVEELVLTLMSKNGQTATLSCNAFGRIPLQLSDLERIFDKDVQFSTL